MSNEPMQDFDWVTVLSLCSVAKVFESLRSQVKKDVETRKAIGPKASHYEFDFTSNGRDFSAFVEGNNIHRSIIFTLENPCISVRDEKETLMFKVCVTLNDEGRCVVRIDDKECELWQVRKKALEGLFFTRH